MDYGGDEMYQPIFSSGNVKRFELDSFAGLNRTQTISDEEFHGMKNMTGAYPYIAVRPGIKSINTFGGIPKTIVSISESDDGTLFTGVGEHGGKNLFFHENTPIKYNGNLTYNLVAKSAAIMGRKVYIFPDKLYFDLDKREDGLLNMPHKITASTALTFKSQKDTNDVITNYIESTVDKYWDGFKKGDSVIISACSEKTNNTNLDRTNAVDKADIVSVVVEKVESKKIYLLCYNQAGTPVALTTGTYTFTIETRIPDVDYICVHNNRLWGCGVDGKTIYASKLGDGTNFNSFAGLSTDSWWGEVATDGGFTCIVSYQNHVYAFKDYCLHEVYGDKPSNFKIPYLTKTGCVSSKAITEVAGTLYFAAKDGVYAYGGGSAACISQKLEICPTNAVFGYDGRRVFACIDNVLYQYDTQFRMWYEYENMDISDFYLSNGTLYIASQNGIHVYGGHNGGVDWSLTTKEYQTAFSKTNIINLWLALSLGGGTSVNVYVKTDDDPFYLWDTVRADVSRVARVPMRLQKCDRFQVKLVGSGDAMLYGLCFENQIGGKSILRTGGML